MLSSLSLVHSYTFEPKLFNEFLTTDNYFYQNRFTPSKFMINGFNYDRPYIKTNEIPKMHSIRNMLCFKSIILEYLHLIADFNEENFLYIMN